MFSATYLLQHLMEFNLTEIILLVKMLTRLTNRKSQPFRLTALTILVIVLPSGLWSAQSRALFRVFWVNYGRVPSFQVLSNAGRTSLVLLQLPLGEKALQLSSGINTLNCTQEVCVGGKKA